MAIVANAGSSKRYFQNPRWPSDQSIHAQSILNPTAASTAAAVNASVGPTSAAATSITSFVAQPSVPRNLVITPGSTTADVGTCVITVTGTNIFNASNTETFSFAADQTTAVTGAEAFKSISSVAFAADCEATPFTASWSVGYGEKLGLNRCMANAGDIVFSMIDGAKEATAPTIVVDADEVEKNTADFNGTMDGSADFTMYYFHNYRCE